MKLFKSRDCGLRSAMDVRKRAAARVSMHTFLSSTEESSFDHDIVSQVYSSGFKVIEESIRRKGTFHCKVIDISRNDSRSTPSI